MVVPALSTAASEPEILEVTSNGGTASNLVPGAIYMAQMHYRDSKAPGGVQSSAQHAGITVEA